MGITNTIASSTSTRKAQQQSKKKQATMNKSVGLALLALVCLAQASAALPFSSPYTEAEKFREKGRRAIRQLDLKMDELHTAIALRKTQRAIAKLRRSQTRTLQSTLDGEALFDDVVRERIEERQAMLEQRAADQEQVREDAMDDLTDWMDDLADSQGRALLFSELNEGSGRALQVHNIARGINAESKATVVAGAVTDNKDMMKAGVAATAISGAAKIATRPALGSPLGRAVRKGKRKLRRGVRRALRG